MEKCLALIVALISVFAASNATAGVVTDVPALSFGYLVCATPANVPGITTPKQCAVVDSMSRLNSYMASQAYFCCHAKKWRRIEDLWEVRPWTNGPGMTNIDYGPSVSCPSSWSGLETHIHGSP